MTLFLYRRNNNSIVWDFDTISSVFFLVLFVGIVGEFQDITVSLATTLCAHSRTLSSWDLPLDEEGCNGSGADQGVFARARSVSPTQFRGSRYWTLMMLQPVFSTIEGSQMRVQTSAVAPSREEYIAKTQRYVCPGASTAAIPLLMSLSLRISAFERSAAKFAAHPAALTFGRADGQSNMDPGTNVSSGAALDQGGSTGTSRTAPER
jgi:hypothetical protein